MMVLRGSVALSGSAIVGFGLAVVLEVTSPPATLGHDAVDLLGTDYLVVAGVGVAAALVTLFVGVAWTMTSINQFEVPNPEDLPTVPRPGDEFQRYVDGRAALRTNLIADEPERVRRRLRETATNAVMLHHGCPRDVARRYVETGEWTDDVEAAAYLGGRTGPRPPRSSRTEAALAGRTWSQRGARRAAAAIVELADGDPP